jgi:hypothetical protein
MGDRIFTHSHRLLSSLRLQGGIVDDPELPLLRDKFLKAPLPLPFRIRRQLPLNEGREGPRFGVGAAAGGEYGREVN